MGITPRRFVGLSVFLGFAMLSSTSRAGTINESYVEFFAQSIDVSTTTVVDGLGYADALWDDDVYRANIGIFTNLDGLPDALITQTGPFAPISGTYDFPVSPATTLSAGTYWVLGGYNRTGNREDVEENEGTDYVASLPSTWTFGNQFYHLYGDVGFYAVTAEPTTSSDGTVIIGDTGGRHVVRYDKADVDAYDPDADFFIDAQYIRTGDVADSEFDSLDYILWAGQFSDPANDLDDPDANGDGNIDGIDYLVWGYNFGSYPPSQTYAPEPTTCSLLLLGALPLLLRRRRR